MKKIILTFCLLLFFLFFRTSSVFAVVEPSVHLFYSQSCPHCHSEIEYLTEYKTQHPEVEVYLYEIGNNKNDQIYQMISMVSNLTGGGVPLTVVGNTTFIGFADPETSGKQIDELVEQARSENLESDPVKDLIKQMGVVPDVKMLEVKKQDNNKNSLQKDSENNGGEQEKPKFNTTSSTLLKVPFFGQVDLKKFSLPVLTIVVGLVDGFNPCAMWSLMFLISLLLGMNDRKRMWLFGSAFILVSGLVYYFFMAAWLNLFMFVGLISWVRITIGLVALGSGGYYLYDYYVNKTGDCKVDAGGKKQRFFEKLKLVTQQRNLILALFGIIALAFAVNLVELVCSAGLPAVYTQVLSMSNLPTLTYYLYLFFYILLYMLDDLIIFIIAMVTLKHVGMNSKYGRWSHLIGGFVLLFIGLAMVFKPSLIMFG